MMPLQGHTGSCLPAYMYYDYTWQLHKICSFKNKSSSSLQPDHTMLRIAASFCSLQTDSHHQRGPSEITINGWCVGLSQKVAWYWFVQSTCTRTFYKGVKTVCAAPCPCDKEAGTYRVLEPLSWTRQPSGHTLHWG